MSSNIIRTSLLVSLFISLFLVSCKEDNRFRIDFSDVPPPFSISNPVSVDTTDSGLIIYVLEEGSGSVEVNPRDHIRFYFTKRFYDDKDEILSSSYANGVTKPNTEAVTTAGNPRDAIREKQFREGVIGMKEGEKRVLLLTPPILSYNGNLFSYSQDTIWVDVEIEEIITF